MAKFTSLKKAMRGKRPKSRKVSELAELSRLLKRIDSLPREAKELIYQFLKKEFESEPGPIPFPIRPPVITEPFIKPFRHPWKPPIVPYRPERKPFNIRIRKSPRPAMDPR